MAVINLGLTANSSTPLYDPAYPAGNRPAPSGGTYTVTGTGFGTKDATTPVYEDFEGEAVGSTTGDINDITFRNGNGREIISTGALAGTRSLRHDFSSQFFPGAYVVLSGTRKKVYGSAYIKFNGLSGDVWKHGRAGASTVYSGIPRSSMEYTSGFNSTTPTGASSSIWSGSTLTTSYGAWNTAVDNPPAAYPTDTTLFYEFELYAGTIDVLDASAYERVNGVPTTTFDNRPFLTTGNPALPTWFLTPMNGHDGVNTMFMTMDSVYVDESRARVVMTDNATYASSTKWAVQPVSSWSDTSVVADKKRQYFDLGDTCYLHLFDDDGVLVDSGSSFTVTEDNV